MSSLQNSAVQDLTQLSRQDIEPEVDKLRELVTLALAEAKRLGASAAEASANLDAGFSIAVRQGEVETIEHQRDRNIGVTVYFGQRKAHASSADFSTKAINDSVAAAVSRARFTAEDDCSGLAAAELMASEMPDLDLWHPWDITPDAAIALALEAESAAFSTDERISNSDGSNVNTGGGIRVYGNSHGFMGVHAGTSHSLSCSIIAGTGDGMQRDYWYSYGRDGNLLDSPASVGKRAASRAIGRLGSRQLETCSAPVMYVPELARSLFGAFLGAISGGAQFRNSSFLLGAEGETVFSPHIQLQERPHLRKAMSSAAFDSEGVATRNHDWVKDGVLQGYLLSSYSARKLGRELTAENSGNAGGVFNMLVSHGDKDQAALLKQMGDGLLVTEMMGSGTNRITGDYSRGAAGFWIENGEIAYPVEEITVAGNLKQMFKQIVAVGSDVDRRSNIQTGSVLLEEMTIAGG